MRDASLGNAICQAVQPTNTYLGVWFNLRHANPKFSMFFMVLFTLWDGYAAERIWLGRAPIESQTSSNPGKDTPK